MVVGLSRGWYTTPDLEWAWDGSKGRPFNYFCYGACVSEVEVDCLPLLVGDATCTVTYGGPKMAQ